MKNRIFSNPSLESLDEGDIIRTEDGYLLICVPDASSECQKALTDGDIWVVNDDQIGGCHFIDPAEYPTLITPDRMEVFRFLLQRASNN
jgi:hypothetical protein